jgi:hypothetical protein
VKDKERRGEESREGMTKFLVPFSAVLPSFLISLLSQLDSTNYASVIPTNSSVVPPTKPPTPFPTPVPTPPPTLSPTSSPVTSDAEKFTLYYIFGIMILLNIYLII